MKYPSIPPENNHLCHFCSKDSNCAKVDHMLWTVAAKLKDIGWRMKTGILYTGKDDTMLFCSEECVDKGMQKYFDDNGVTKEQQDFVKELMKDAKAKFDKKYKEKLEEKQLELYKHYTEELLNSDKCAYTDWDGFPPEYRWRAFDEDGDLNYYNQEPKPGVNGWDVDFSSGGDFIRGGFLLAGCPKWRLTLQTKPE